MIKLNLEIRKEGVILMLTTIFFLVPIFFGCWYVVEYSVNVPFWDMWFTIVVWTLSAIEGKFKFDYLFLPHNDSRVTVPILVILVVSLLTSMNIKVFYIFGYILYLFFVLLMIYFAGQNLKFKKLEYIFIVPIIYYALNPLFLTRYIVNIGAVVYPLTLLFAILSLYYLSKSKNSYKKLILSLILAFACSLSNVSGFAVWFAGIFQLLIQKMDEKIKKIAIWTGGSLFFFVLHFLIFPPLAQSGVHSTGAYITYIKTTIYYPLQKFLCLMGVLGSEVIFDRYTALFFGLLILAVFLGLIATNKGLNRNIFDAYSLWFGFLGFGIFNSTFLVITRSGDLSGYFGPPDNIYFIPDIRHQPVYFMILICVYIIALAYARNSNIQDKIKDLLDKRAVNIFLLAIVFTLLISSPILNFKKGMDLGKGVYSGMIELQLILKTFDAQPDENLRKLGPIPPEVVRERAELLRKYNLTVFAEIENTNKILLYKPSKIKILPQQTQITSIGKINESIKIILNQHPITNKNLSIIAFENITIPENAKLKFSLALAPGVWDPNKGDGVTFEIFIKCNGKEEKIFSKYIDPKHNPEERKWNDFEVNLSEYAGRNVTIVFSTLPGPNNDSSWDWAWWGEPRIEW